MNSDDAKDRVYGIVYDSAVEQMNMLRSALEQHAELGFETDEACAAWAADHLLDKLVYLRSQHQFYNVSHTGDILTKRAWLDAYGSDLLFVWEFTDGKPTKARRWLPEGIKYHTIARVGAERPEQGRLPLYHRDYYMPAGFFDQARGTFNVAKAFTTHAKQTGADTSHVYRYIQAIAGECAMHVLAWLRAKLVQPTVKTQVVPIFVSRAQGTGKTTFAEVICKGLFESDNVLVTDQYDAQSRFNVDYADALIICHEESDHEDRRNPAGSLKSRATATTIRKEHKGLDPVYQESYTDFILTSNKDVPIKFDDDSDQRRFMVMEADENFTRKQNKLADEVYTKLYGRDANGNPVGIPFAEDKQLISQFKHELFSREDIKDVDYRKFPHTAAYNKCFTLPRTTEATEIEAIVRTLAPFIKASLEKHQIIDTVTVHENESNQEEIVLGDYLTITNAMQLYPATPTTPEHIAICRPLVFVDAMSQRAFSHAVVERAIYDCERWLVQEFGLRVYPVTGPIPGGFYGVQSRYRTAPTARFVLASAYSNRPAIQESIYIEDDLPATLQRIGQRLRVNGKWQVDPNGEFETVNELKPGTFGLNNKTAAIQYMDTFLFEADSVTKYVFALEQERVAKQRMAYGEDGELNAEQLFRERLHVQLKEADRLYKEGKVARVVYSGGKSYHMLVRVTDAPTTLDQYRWLHGHLAAILSDKLVFDAVTTDPARLTRAPINYMRTFEYSGIAVKGQQRAISTDWTKVYAYNWRALYQQWVDRPREAYEVGRKLIPTKPEYREAMLALLKGTFWTDKRWHGVRQQCFFPAYRLCRYIGYTHAQLWSTEGILEGLDKYYRAGEKEYWASREQSDIIEQIDRDVEAMEAMEKTENTND